MSMNAQVVIYLEMFAVFLLTLFCPVSILFCNFLLRLTVLVGLKRDLSALFLPLWVGQWQTDMDAVVGWQITQREAWGVVFHCQALAYGGVVASAASRRGVAVAQGHWVGVATCQVERQILPLQGQLPGLDVCGNEAPQCTHWLWEGGRLEKKRKEIIETEMHWQKQKHTKGTVLNFRKWKHRWLSFIVKYLISDPADDNVTDVPGLPWQIFTCSPPTCRHTGPPQHGGQHFAASATHPRPPRQSSDSRQLR